MRRCTEYRTLGAVLEDEGGNQIVVEVSSFPYIVRLGLLWSAKAVLKSVAITSLGHDHSLRCQGESPAIQHLFGDRPRLSRVIFALVLLSFPTNVWRQTLTSIERNWSYFSLRFSNFSDVKCPPGDAYGQLLNLIYVSAK